MRRAVFLDRDGVVNRIIYHEEMGIIDTPFTADQFELMPGIADAVRCFKENGYKVFVITNQPGVAKGHFNLDTLNAMHDKMLAQLSSQGAALDGVYTCLHHPEARVKAYKKVCECRKPKPGLLLQASRDHGIVLQESVMIGDSLTDVDAGKRAGCVTVLLGKRKCDLCRHMEEQGLVPDYIVDDIGKIFEITAKHEYIKCATEVQRHRERRII